MKKKISILDTGAIPGISALQTVAFQKALDDIFLAGGGTVVVPKGKYHIGGVRLRSGTTLYLCEGAEIYGSGNPEDYSAHLDDTLEKIPEEFKSEKVFKPWKIHEKNDYSFTLPAARWCNAVIRAINAENISVVGEKNSFIDGLDCFDELGESGYRGPHGISMHYCKNVTLRGYTIRNTGNWAHAIYYSENILYENVTVLAGHDGIHVTCCENVKIRGSEFYTGDDCIAGFENVNVFVSGCVINTACSGLRFGGTNVFVRDCRFFGPARHFFRGSLTPGEKRSGAKPGVPHRTNMLSVFTYYSDFSAEIKEQPGNIIISDCRADNVDRFLHFNYSGNELWQSNRPLKSIKFENMEAYGISMPLTAYGSPEDPLDFEMKNITFSFREGSEDTAFIHTANYERIVLNNIKISNKNGGPLIKSWAKAGEGDIRISNLSCECEEENRIVYTDEPFNCKPI